ncbi:hypothetical protein [Oscillatoria sp. FACHB-1406]|uniref:hypothetical protein n=1 Tax=Oscillatoria sp. FACHB-1406 TaxID=2692846 RepID=UPI001686E422|nr:hypothetical protein [Oscillatoria sp. FACHB-1406]MBD2578462.1 hypothetical protein [Oscillatoria sp. FACHB-1406]
MTTYRIRGLVVTKEIVTLQLLTQKTPDQQKQLDQAVRNHTSGLWVEIWDKDERFDDRLGRAKTDSYGFFEIEFTKDAFRQEPYEMDDLPDLFFRVYQGKQLLFSSEGEVEIGEFKNNRWESTVKSEGVTWNWQDWDANTSLKFPVPQFSVADKNFTSNDNDSSETTYAIQVYETWIIPDVLDREIPSFPLIEDTWENQVIDVLPTLDQVERSGYRTAVTTSDGSGGTLQQIVDSALSQVLSRSSKEDPKAFVASLTKAFTPQETNGRTDYIWTPCTYSTVQTELGGAVSGAQASLYHRAKAALNEMLPLLDKLYPLNAVVDPQNMEAARAIFRTEVVELVNELGTQGGPRAQRVDSLFQMLIGNVGPEDPYEIVGGQMRELADIFGLNRANVNTVEEEQNYGNYLIIRDYLVSLRGSWKTYSENSGAGAFVGSQLVLLSQALSVVAESVQEVYRIMDLVFLGSAERQSVWIDFTKTKVKLSNNTPPTYGTSSYLPPGQFPLPDGTLYTKGLQLTPAMTVEGLLSWVMRFATQEGPALARSGGKIGIARSLKDTADRLTILVQAASFVPVPNSAYRRAGVTRSFKDLAFQLYQVKRLAQELIPPITSLRAIDAGDLNR